MNEGKKFQKRKVIFQTVCAVISVAILIYFVIVVLNNPIFNTDCIIAVSVFFGTVSIICLGSILIERRERKLVEKHFGAVSEEDREKSKDLLGRVDVIRSGDYTFLTDDGFEFCGSKQEVKWIKHCLKWLAKGRKIEKNLISVYFDIQKELETSSDRDLESSVKLQSYFSELTELFGRNSYEF